MSDKKDPASVSRVVVPKLGVNQRSAGAGLTGLIGFLLLGLVSLLFFVTENYFIAMFIISVALMVYVTGLDIAKIMVSSFTIFFSSRHLIEKGVHLQETMFALNKSLNLKRDEKGEILVGPLPQEAVLVLPDNPLVRDIQCLIREERSLDYAAYLAHSYYVECHELYDYANGNLEFVADAMPLFGLIGTIVGLIAMFDGLGANVTIESLTPQLALALKTTLYGAVFASLYKIISSRFDQRLKALEYDYETFLRAIEVIVQNKNVIEVKSS
ncbi:MAG: MotA/TolQ/ExbB proton channel family protein [Oligoflexus sp.]